MTLVYQGTEPGRPAINPWNLRSNKPFLLDFRRSGAGFAFSTWQIQLLFALIHSYLASGSLHRTFVPRHMLDVYGLLRIDDFNLQTRVTYPAFLDLN